MKKTKKLQIAVIGSAGGSDRGSASRRMEGLAQQVGEKLARAGAIVVTGGKDGIMLAAARGAKNAGGITVGVVRGPERGTANEFTDIEVITGMAAAGLDELAIVLMSDALIVIGGGAGTLQEIAIAYRNKKPVIALTSVPGWGSLTAGKCLDTRKTIKVVPARTPEAAVRSALRALIKSSRTKRP